jgi:Bacteriophage baseplate protein W
VTTPVAAEFLGIGWGFPLGTDPVGEVRTAAYEEDVRQAIRIILATGRGERVMRPDFGAGLNQFVFEPMNATTMELVRHRVEEALVLWEPRIDSITVQVSTEAFLEGEPRTAPGTPKPGRDAALGRLFIEVRYRVRATNTFYNLVYPFYLLEAKGPS